MTLEQIDYFNGRQKKLLESLDIPLLMELFDLNITNIKLFLQKLHIIPKQIVLPVSVFKLHHISTQKYISIAIFHDVLSYDDHGKWKPLSLHEYKILGIFLSEHLRKDPFIFMEKSHERKPKMTIIELMFEMNISDLGKRKLSEILETEILPPRKHRAFTRTLEKMKQKRTYTVQEIFTKMPLSRVGNLTISEFFGAEVFQKRKNKHHV